MAWVDCSLCGPAARRAVIRASTGGACGRRCPGRPGPARLARTVARPRRANGRCARRQRIDRAGSFTTGHPRGPQAAPTEPTDVRFPINLATALRLSDARPLIVAAAQARVWVAEAELTQAKVLWLPDLNIGFDYIRHDGGGPDFNKGIMTAPSTNFFYAGAGLWGTIWGSSPRPMPSTSPWWPGRS